MKHLLILFILCLTNCAIFKKCITVETILDSNTENLQQLSVEVKEKLGAAGFKQTEITIAEKKLLVKSRIASEDLKPYTILLASNRLDFWDTYKHRDPEIQGINFDKLKIAGFISLPELGTTTYLDEVIGGCQDESKLDQLTQILADSLSYLSDLKLLWSKEKQGYNEKVYYLYVLNTKGRKNAPLTDLTITKAVAEQHRQSGEYTVRFNFDEKGKEIWKQMTEKAAADNQRSIAIVINDRVYSCPRVMETISGGSCMMTGNFSKEEAQQLAYIIMAKRYTSDVKVESQVVLKGNK